MMKAEYNHRPNRSAGTNIIVEVFSIDRDRAEVEFKSCRRGRKSIATSRLKPYLDPDADGSQWLFLGYMIVEQIHPKLARFAIYDKGDNFIKVTDIFPEAKKIVIKEVINSQK